MTRKRLLAAGMLAAIAVLTPVACSDGTAPGTDGPLMVSAQLDGSPWAPEHGNNLFARRTLDGRLVVAGFRRDSLGRTRDAIGFQLVGFTRPGRYALTADPYDDTGFYSLNDQSTGGSTGFHSLAANPGVVTVTELDTVAHRLAGRFSFDAAEEGGTRVVHIEHGVFRVEYEIVP